MNEPTVHPYGEWPSPIDANALATGSRSFEQIELDGDDICWVEVRPDEKGLMPSSRARSAAAFLALLQQPYGFEFELFGIRRTLPHRTASLQAICAYRGVREIRGAS
jgi:hypothetical protein